MRTFIGMLVAACASQLQAAIWTESVVTTAEKLRQKGFVIEARAVAGTIPSVEISVRVPADSEEERFIKTCMVTADYSVSGSNVEIVDRNRDLPRTERNDRDASFVLFTKSAERCYLSIEFRCPDSKGMRHERSYLLPLADLISKEEANRVAGSG